MTKPREIPLTPGSFVYAEGRRYRVKDRVGLDRVLAEDLETGFSETVSVKDIEQEPAAKAATTPDLEAIPAGDLKAAARRYELIKPLIDAPRRTKTMVLDVAKAAGCDVTTIYDWLRLHRENARLTALVPQRRGPKRGSTRIDPAIEDIVKTAIEEIYLSEQRGTASDVIQAVLKKCRADRLVPPNGDTVRRRIHDLHPELVLRRRGQRDEARRRFRPVHGSFPGADFPLAVVQIDHTPADIIVVDEEQRLPIGRPTITLATDVFSRMVVGIYLSLEAPSALAAGMCISRAILPKEKYLAKIGVHGNWPVWGFMRAIHADNAAEFRGVVLEKGCQEYGIALEHRRQGRPEDGGNIESLMRLAAEHARKLPGATFNSPKAREGYDSDKEAALTLVEYERVFVDFIVNDYHQRIHSALHVTPLHKWRTGLEGTSRHPGPGLPAKPADERKVELDFMPFEHRTVQRYGILLKHIHYFDPALMPWVEAPDPEHPNEKRKFVVRYDPRDMSQVYFFDPLSKEYLTIPYGRLGRPAVSLWEIDAAIRRLKEEGRQNYDENAVFESIERRARQVAEAVATTKRVRREKARKPPAATNTAAVLPAPPASEKPSLVPASLADDDLFSQPVVPLKSIRY